MNLVPLQEFDTLTEGEEIRICLRYGRRLETFYGRVASVLSRNTGKINGAALLSTREQVNDNGGNCWRFETNLHHDPDGKTHLSWHRANPFPTNWPDAAEHAREAELRAMNAGANESARKPEPANYVGELRRHGSPS